MSFCIDREKTSGSRARGVSLVELMVALALGVFLLLGLTSLLLAVNKTGRLESALVEIQDNVRFALDALSSDLRGAHYSGCRSIDARLTVMARDTRFQGVYGFERSGRWWPDSATAELPGTVILRARHGSDILGINSMVEPAPGLLNRTVNDQERAVVLADNPGCVFRQDQLAAISSCRSAHLFRITNEPVCRPSEHGSPAILEFGLDGNISNAIDEFYPASASTKILLLKNVLWYVADTGRDRNGFDVYAIYRKENRDPAREIVRGIESMQLLYGFRDGAHTRYVTARDSRLEWHKVVAVRIGLLLQAYEQVLAGEDETTYSLLDEAIGPAESVTHGGGRVLRKMFSTTVVLRNTPYQRQPAA